MANTKTSSIDLTRLSPQQARDNFKFLLQINPNYFGTIPDSKIGPVLPIAKETSYEELTCVGYSAPLNRLEAVVNIKQNFGYGGGICTDGSHEYVRFYVSWDNGATWIDQGFAGLSAHDIAGPKPLRYAVSVPFAPSHKWCFVSNLPKVRAILSWNIIPTAGTPGFIPVWGNILEAVIQIPGFKFLPLVDLLAEAKLTLPAQYANLIDSSQPIPLAAQAKVPTAQLLETYKAEVPPHRSLYSHVANSAATAAPSPIAPTLVEKYKLDLSAIISAILATNGNTTYEGLECLGLDPNRSALSAVVNVKKSSGFSGGPCTAGSTEYVAFWINWGAGFEYLGTTTINAHDFSGIPATGLHYATALPVDFSSHQQPCAAGPKLAVVRAILSWETAPPPANPNYVPVWGNRVDAEIQIPAGDPFVIGTPNIAIIGGIGVASIDTNSATAHPGMTLPNAVFALTGTPADPWIHTRSCAFGGRVVIQGLPSPGSKYRVRVREAGAAAASTLVTPIAVTNGLGQTSTSYPDASGFFTYLNATQNIDNNLAYWDSSGDSAYDVWLEIADNSDTVLGSTPLYRIQLDNTAPYVDIHIDSGGDCKQFSLKTVPSITGKFTATDTHFGAFSLDTTPVSINPNQPTTSAVATSPATDAAWTLSTAGMQPCGYVIELWAYDNTIVHSSPGNHNGNRADVGFCLIA